MVRRLLFLAALLVPLAAAAQPGASWQSCTAVIEGPERLACFDRWAREQGGPERAVQQSPATPPVATLGLVPPQATCRDEQSQSALPWLQDPAPECGLLGIRSYRPISLSVIASDSVNKLPTSENPQNAATASQPFRTTETRVQLSVRSKLLDRVAPNWPLLNGALWFGYSQQSYWQVFTPDVSRPFRNTDHEPEAVYVLPLSGRTVAGWTPRYVGIGLVHQSNGQSLPYSRSWNRVYLMAGAEHAGGFSLHGRVWQRLDEDAAKDDNPEISHYVGRVELTGGWTHANGNQLLLTWRNNLRDLRHGSLRGEWLLPIDSLTTRNFGSLNLHTQLFTGYGDSLIDYNRRRTVLSLGVSLVDW